MGDFLLGIQREKMAFGSVFFVSRAVVRGSEILRRVPQQIWCQKNATFSSCPSWYIYTQSLTTERVVSPEARHRQRAVGENAPPRPASARRHTISAAPDPAALPPGTAHAVLRGFPWGAGGSSLCPIQKSAFGSLA